MKKLIKIILCIFSMLLVIGIIGVGLFCLFKTSAFLFNALVFRTILTLIIVLIFVIITILLNLL